MNMNARKNIIAGLVYFATTVCGAGIFIALGVRSSFLFVLSFLVIPVVSVCTIDFMAQQQAFKIRKYVSRSSTANHVVLHKRSPHVRYAITISPVLNIHYQYNPLEVHYTGTTIGGFTTGKFKTTGNDYSLKCGGTSGKYQLAASFDVITFGDKNKTIPAPIYVDSIELTDELVAEASKHPFIKQFLCGNKLVLKHSTTNSTLLSETFRTADAKNDLQTKSIIANQIHVDSRLTFAECKTVLDWLCGK